MVADPYERFTIAFGPMQTGLSEIPIAIANRIGREKRAELASVHVGYPAFLRLTVRVAAATFSTMQYVCADAPKDYARKPEFAICVPPLARTLLDSLFNLLLVFDDPPFNVRWFFAAGWREEFDHLQRLSQKHAGDATWAKYISRYRRERLNPSEQEAGVSPEEKRNPSKIARWPHPGGLLKIQRQGQRNKPGWISSAKRRAFLEFLDDWHYGKLSSDSHLAPFGLVRRGWMLTAARDRDDDWAENVAMYRSQVFFNALVLYLALLSEVAVELGFAHEIARLRELWKHILRWPEAQELLEVRYAEMMQIDTALPNGIK